MVETSAGTASIPITLKWSKQVFSLDIRLGECALDFKKRVQEQTGVPVSRQKLLAKKGGWKGPLKDEITLDATIIKEHKSLTVTLIGSAETLVEPVQKTVFVEDMTPEELREAENAEAQAAMATAEGMIQALQLLPHRRDDRKQETYQYNRLVNGLPQRQIEQELKYGQRKKKGQIEGKVALNMGLELRRAYINDIAVLDDGTCVSVMDDGHVQLWKHAAQQQDAVHPGNEGGVDSVVAFRNKTAVSFATAGRGSLQLWSADADPIMTLPGGLRGTSPASLEGIFGSSSRFVDRAVICLAARFQITRPNNPMQFRLPPQNEAERQRRAMAEAQERAVQQALSRASRSIQVWYAVTPNSGSARATSSSASSFQYKVLEPPGGIEESAPITSLATLNLTGVDQDHLEDEETSSFLVAGDAAGGLRIWKVTYTPNDNHSLRFIPCGFFKLFTNSSQGSMACSVICMEALPNGRLGVSTDAQGEGTNSFELTGSTPIVIAHPRAVHVLDFSYLQEGIGDVLEGVQTPSVQATLTGHTSNDAVICICGLPNGDLLTGGGKLDATLQLWKNEQINGDSDGSGNASTEMEVIDESTASTMNVQRKACKVLKDVGYVFALQVLPDAKQHSKYYAVAAGRYNTVKIII